MSEAEAHPLIDYACEDGVATLALNRLIRDRYEVK